MIYLLASLLFACADRGTKAEVAPPAPTPPEAAPIQPARALPSLYDLSLPLVGSDGQPTSLDVHRGHPVLVSMFYASCHSACPMLVQNVRAFEASLPEAHRAKLRVLLVSLDPERDNPAALAEAATRYGADPSRWVLAIPEATRVRELAAAIGIQYRPGEDGEIHHTSVLLLLDAQGREIARSSGPEGSLDSLKEALE